jgi:ATP-dependent DNA helicase RecQ
VRYFGQSYETENCGACDVCLNDEPAFEGSDEIARLVVACISRLGMPYGVGSQRSSTRRYSS